MSKSAARTQRGSTGAGRPAGRQIALEAVSAFHERSAFVGRVVDQRSRELRAPAPERALALELAAGVVRRQATLDAILPLFVDRPRAAIEDGLWALLQLGAYQLLLLPEMPRHAAVNETVEVARRIHRPRWGPLANAVLRSLSDVISDEFADAPGPDRVPLADGYRRLTRAVFPDPGSDPVAYLAKAHSYPRWLVREWLARCGSGETTRLCQWFNRPPLMTLRVNRRRQSRDVLLEVLAAAKIDAQPGEHEDAVRLSGRVSLFDLPGFAEGWFSVQDETAMAAGSLLDPQPGQSVLDLCAAPGGKTAHLAELMDDRGRILAADSNADRLHRVTENAARLGLQSITPLAVSAEGDGLPEGPFDAVLVDVPCSNTGVLGKRPEARWRISPAGIDELAELQTRLLQQAAGRTRRGGRLVYSTCSIEPRENRQVVETLLQSRGDFTLLGEVEHIPGRPADGGYQALLQRAGGG